MLFSEKTVIGYQSGISNVISWTITNQGVLELQKVRVGVKEILGRSPIDLGVYWSLVFPGLQKP